MNETEFREIGSMSLMKAIRIGLGLSGTQITIRSGVGPARISLLERGLDQPRPLEREQLSRALKVPAAAVDQRVRLFVEMPQRREEAATEQPVRRRPRAKGIPAE